MALDRYQGQTGKRGLSSALSWLGRGSGIAILPGPGLWILDVDDAALADRVVSDLLDGGVVPLGVRTPSGGMHLYFRYPEGFPTAGLKCHVCHPRNADGETLPLDIKLQGRTLVIAPGTVRKGRMYEPMAPWRTPPTLDPRVILPDGDFWHPQEPKRPFLTMDRPLRNRLAQARVYLAKRAPIAISGRHGHRALSGVTAHLVAYLKLEPETAASLMIHGSPSWNSRCIDPSGRPCPWSQSELLSACRSAVGSVPAAGVKAWERAQAAKVERERLAGMVKAIQDSLTTKESHRVPVAKIRRVLGWWGHEVSQTALGDELVSQGIKRTRTTRKRVWSIGGLTLPAIHGRFLEVARQGIGTVCPLLRAREGEGGDSPTKPSWCSTCSEVDTPPSLPVEHEVSGPMKPPVFNTSTPPVERQVSRGAA